MSDYEWLRSSFCASGACVEVSLSDDGSVLVRDSKLGKESPVLSFTSGAWARVLQDTTDGNLPDGAGFLTDGGTYWGPLEFTADEWFAFVEDLDEFTYDRLFTGDEAGSGFRGVARSGQAATGAGAIAVPPVPVAAQPRYVLDAPAILELVKRYGEAERDAADSFMRPAQKMAARDEADNLLRAIGVALTPVPDVEPEPAWGSGPLVKHVTETPAEPQMPYLTGQPVSFVDDGDGQAVQR